VLDQQVELSLVRYHHQNLALLDDPRILPSLDNSGEFCRQPPPSPL
jgi:hypothetical protein